MDTDDLLRRAGERWRARHSLPLALPDFEEAAMPAPTSPRKWPRRGVLIPLAVAAVVALIFVGGAVFSAFRTTAPTGVTTSPPLCEALGAEPPIWAHAPILVTRSGRSCRSAATGAAVALCPNYGDAMRERSA
ncbi:MAG TPA: hypothetical protein VFI47_01305 [Acidimicrobiales bacterium]|nr:hypothetical protein [Acidimicrobiales bacterium]